MEENKSIRTSIIQIGNSQGIRLPKALLAMSQIEDEVDLEVKNGSIIIRPVKKPREGWEEAFKQMANSEDDDLLDQAIVNQWDQQEWEW